MGPFDDPVDLFVYMLEKTRAVALLETLEDFSDVDFGNHKCLLSLREQLRGSTFVRTNCPCPKNLDLRVSLIQYMIQAFVICFGDDDGAAPHPIFSGCR